MKLTWYGHAAFLLESESSSTRVVLDPYRAPDVGTYEPIDDWADIVAISHDNEKYHSYAAGIRGRDEASAPVWLMDWLFFHRHSRLIFRILPSRRLRFLRTRSGRAGSRWSG